MKIKLIDFGVPEHQRPYRPHGNDAGADVYLPYDCTLQPGEIAKIPLGFGLEIPDGYAGYIFPRTSMAVKGLVCELPQPYSYRISCSMTMPDWNCISSFSLDSTLMVEISRLTRSLSNSGIWQVLVLK